MPYRIRVLAPTGLRKRPDNREAYHPLEWDDGHILSFIRFCLPVSAVRQFAQALAPAKFDRVFTDISAAVFRYGTTYPVPLLYPTVETSLAEELTDWEALLALATVLWAGVPSEEMQVFVGRLVPTIHPNAERARHMVSDLAAEVVGKALTTPGFYAKLTS